MKRKRELLDHSDDEDVTFTPTEKPRKPPKKDSKLKNLVVINVLIFSIVVIPLLAITHLDHAVIFEGLDEFVGERCSSKYWKLKNITHLKDNLDDFLFGQHVAKSVILSALNRRWRTPGNYHKPLVMSFHGWTGSGKNYVAKFIAESLFKKGMKSSFVKIYISTVHFHDESKVMEYQQNLRDWILGNVTKCSDTLFIFDEVDKMPAGVLDALKPFMDHHSIIDGTDMSSSIFILLSNTGGKEIAQKTFDFWHQGRNRNELRYADYEQLVLRGAFNEIGGLQKSLIIDKSLIDIYVPFLPLEQIHVRQCIERELKLREIQEDDIIGEVSEQILSDMLFWPEETQLYSSTGCKRVTQKVDELLYEFGLGS